MSTSRAFGNGNATLNDEQLQALAKSLFPFGLFDPQSRMLKSATPHRRRATSSRRRGRRRLIS